MSLRSKNIIDPIVYGTLNAGQHCCPVCDKNDTWMDELDRVAEASTYEDMIIDHFLTQTIYPQSRVAK